MRAAAEISPLTALVRYKDWVAKLAYLCEIVNLIWNWNLLNELSL